MKIKKSSVGFLALSSIALANVFTSSAQAATIVGGVNFNADGTISDSGEAPPASVVLSDITNFTQESSNGIFADFTVDSVKDLELTQVGDSDQYINDFIDDFKVYTNTTGDLISFDLEGGAIWTRRESALGGVVYGNIEGDPAGIQGVYTRTSDGETFEGSGFLNFSESAGIVGIAELSSTQEAVDTPTAVPEPATILGLFTTLGFGAVLKDKKNKIK